MIDWIKDHFVRFKGTQYKRSQGFRQIAVEGESKWWIPESEMQIIAHDELTGEIEFDLAKNAARKLGLWGEK